MSTATERVTFRAGRAKPCPVCGSASKGCSATESGLSLCRGEPRDGWRRLTSSPDPAGFHHYRAEGDAHRNGTTHPPPRPPRRDWPAMAAGYAAALTPELRAELAASLGLPTEAIAALPVGWCADEGCWTFPELDADGSVVGIVRRFRDGTKLAMTGGRRGLSPAAGWRDAPGPVLLPEGPSCVLALALCGLPAVGRPNNAGGVELLAGLLKGFPAERGILVVGEHDRKPEGHWPGRDGAESTARELSARLGRPVGWALPPDGAKDCRAWVVEASAGAGEVIDWPAIGRELADHLLRTATTAPLPSSVGAGSATPEWPDPPEPEAFHGPAGDLVRAIEPATEADPVGLLLQFLVGFGNLIGRTAYAVAEDDRHYCNEFAVLVGKTARGRKGTSWGRVVGVLKDVDEGWADDRVVSGLSSGEGLIWSVRDRIVSREKFKQRGRVAFQEVESDPGVKDKRLLVLEPEFASVLKQCERTGNVLSVVVRDAWDRGRLNTLTKNNPARATDAHVSIIGHITADELRRYLTATEMANGFGNRHLFACVRRSKELPEGGTPDAGRLREARERIREAVGFARHRGRVGRDDGARVLWRELYRELTAEGFGLAGSLLARAEAHVLRLSLIYALLDRSEEVRAEHLRAAAALWRYCERSARFVFGESQGDPLADDLLRLLRASPAGQTRTAISAYLGRHVPAAKIAAALESLSRGGTAHSRMVDTGGRSAETWFAGSAPKGA